MRYLGRNPVRLALSGAFLLMGFSFSVTQTLLVREMLVSFAGNELTIGVVLGTWLALEAVGSWGAGWLYARHMRRPPVPGRDGLVYAGLQIILAVLLLPVLAATAGIRHILGGVPGQGWGLPTIFLTSSLLLLPVGLVDGAMFSVGWRAARQAMSDDADAAGTVYVREAIGGILGGLAVTFLLVPRLHAVETALLLVALNLASALCLRWLLRPRGPAGLRSLGRWNVKLLLLSMLLLASLVLLVTPAADRLLHALAEWQWKGYDLAFHDDSVYGNVVAIRQAGQVTFFSNGVPLLSAPVPDIARVEEMVHLPLLWVEQPRRALVLSGGVGGVIGELLKYPLDRVDYAELDPLLLEAVDALPTPLTEAELLDPRVRVEMIDGRLFVHRATALQQDRQPVDGAYDIVLVNLPVPTTLQINRFYTVEFCRMVGQLMDDGGVLVFAAPGSLTYLSPGVRSLHAVLQATLQEAFPHVRPIPGDVTLWLASPSSFLTLANNDTLIKRWDSRGLPSNLITESYLRLRLDERWLTWFQGALGHAGPAQANHDLRPAALLQGLAYWNEMFSPRLSSFFSFLRKLNFAALALPLVILALLGLFVVRRRQGSTGVVAMAIATTGFGGMTADLLVIFAFQVFYGYVYQLIGLLLAAFMAGLSLGGWLSRRIGQPLGKISAFQKWTRWFLWTEAALLLFWLLLPAALTSLGGTSADRMSPLVMPALLLLNVLGGLLVGFQFPLANQIVLREGDDAGRMPGMLYAMDLIGAFVAALLVSVALVPALGVAQICLLVAVMKGGSLVLVAVSRARRDGRASASFG